MDALVENLDDGAARRIRGVTDESETRLARLAAALKASTGVQGAGSALERREPSANAARVPRPPFPASELADELDPTVERLTSAPVLAAADVRAQHNPLAQSKPILSTKFIRGRSTLPERGKDVGAEFPQGKMVETLLERTIFYKIGHHGSINATARDEGLER